MNRHGSFRRLVMFGIIAAGASGCAALFKVQLSDLESTKNGKPVSIKVSENTVDFQQVGGAIEAIGRASKSKAAQNAGSNISDIAAAFQFGPRTGVPVFNDAYASTVGLQLFEKCPNGHLGNIISIRESRNYPIISGQIIRIDATCFSR